MSGAGTGTGVSGHRSPTERPTYRIGVDVGGTFTDLVVARPDAELLVAKVPSTPAEPAKGVLAALAEAAKSIGLETEELLARTQLFVHGTTVATNTILERKGATVGLLTTEGFRDSLEIRRGYRPDPWDHRTPYAEVLVPRYLRRVAAGRIDRDGQEVEPLSETDVAAAADCFREEGVESIAICLFNSYLNDRHESAAEAVLAAGAGGEWITVSSRLAPVIGEYERSSTAVLNAYVAPRTVRYLADLDASLQELGLAASALLIQNNGGAISIRQVADQPATLLLSGPAAGVGALRHYAEVTGIGNLISMEIGGTSCDVILMDEGEATLTDHLIIDGYHLALPSIDVHTVGAGGGTIAGVDAAGMLFVGPEGAGARPGPACYGHGGEAPTVTDAQLLLGRLKAGPYAGGALTIDAGLAEKAVADRLAGPLGLTVEEAAIGVIRLMDQKLLHAVQRISIERGHDPARFTLVAGGGAGPLHAVAVGRLLGCRQVYVPRLSGAFCALGMLNTDVRHEYLRVHFAPLAAADLDEIAGLISGLGEEARAMLRQEGFEEGDMRFQPGCDLRYRGQQWDVQVSARDKHFDPAQIREAFEVEHQRLFGHIQPDGPIEITKIRLTATGVVAGQPEIPASRSGGAAAPKHCRAVWIDADNGWQETPVYDGSALGVGTQIVGPALIDERTTTVMIGTGDRLEVDAAGNYMIRLAPGEQERW